MTTSVFNYHRWAYSAFTGNKINTSTAGGGAITAYNSRMRVLKDQYEYQSYDLKGLILFCFTHNPLRLPKLDDYGRVDVVVRAASEFADWRKVKRKLIIEEGLVKSIMKTVPVESKLGEQLEKEIEEAFSI